MDMEPLRESIRKVAQETAEDLNIDVCFSLGRRETDILVIHLRGKRKRVLALLPYLLDTFPDVDVELIRSASAGDEHTLTAVATQKLADQQMSVLERRAKLRLWQSQSSDVLSTNA